MAVIAMTREMGSLGKDVATGLAEALGLQVVHHELVEHDLADKLHVRESTVHRFLEGRPSMLERWKMDDKRLSLYTASEILDLAAGGGVLIRGWGAASLLRPVAHVLRVRVCAPLDFRCQVLMERLGMDDEQFARTEIDRNDAAHSRIMLQQFGVNWENPLLYDLVLNTERVAVAQCVEQVRSLVESPAFQESAGSRRALADLALDARVKSTIYDRFGIPTHNLIVNTKVDSSSGSVTLQGVAGSRDIIAEIGDIVAKVDGVENVENQLTQMGLYTQE